MARRRTLAVAPRRITSASASAFPRRAVSATCVSSACSAALLAPPSRKLSRNSAIGLLDDLLGEGVRDLGRQAQRRSVGAGEEPLQPRLIEVEEGVGGAVRHADETGEGRNGIVVAVMLRRRA